MLSANKNKDEVTLTTDSFGILQGLKTVLSANKDKDEVTLTTDSFGDITGN